MGTLVFELVRLKNYRFFWIFLVLYAVCMTLTFYSGREIIVQSLGQFEQIQDLVMKTTRGMLVMASVSGYFEVFLSYVLIGLLVQEKEYGTLKQHFIDGMSRIDWMVGKSFVVLFLSLVAVALLAGNAVSFLDPSLFSGETLPQSLQIVAAVFLRVFGILTIATLFGVMVTQTVKGIFLFTAYVLFGETLLGYLLNYASGQEIAFWLPYNRFRSMLPAPWSGLENIMVGDLGDAPLIEFPVLPLLVYLALFWSGIYFLMNFKDTVDSSG
jgi:hypothetical protein